MSQEQQPEPKIYVAILKSETGEIRLHEHTDYDTKNGEPFSDYIWSEGNYSCDCNRRLFFDRAIGIESNFDGECGESDFFIIGIFQNGKMVYSDTPPAGETH